MSAIEKVAEMLRHEAESLKACHTLDGDWRGDPAEADYHEMIALADAAISERDELRAKIERMEKQEPECEVVGQVRNVLYEVRTLKYDLPAGTKLYATPGAQPAPSVPPELEPNGMYDGSHHYASGWNDCRAAMLEAQPEAKP